MVYSGFAHRPPLISRIKPTTSTATLARCRGLIGGAATDLDVLESEAHLWAAGGTSEAAARLSEIRGPPSQVPGRRVSLSQDRNAE